MSRWISITVEDLEDAKVAAMVDALRTAALQSGQTDPAPRRIQTVVDNIRRKIASCPQNQLDADTTTIPASLLDMAVDLILADLKGRLEIELTQDERDALARHTRDLDRIASCQDSVEQPDDAIDAEVQSTAGTPSVTTDRHLDRRARRSGL